MGSLGVIDLSTVAPTPTMPLGKPTIIVIMMHKAVL